MRVLIVDDERDLAGDLSLLLAKRGHIVTTVTSDFPRLADFDWTSIDVLVCDLVLSADLTGIEVLITARLANPQLRRVVLSAAAPSHLTELAPYADVVLAKPERLESIAAAVEEA